MDKPVLSRMQRAWLQEIGIDARMLAHFSAEPFAPAQRDAAIASVQPDAATADTPATRPLGGPAHDAQAGRQVSAGATVIAELLKRTPLPTQADAPPQADNDGASVQVAPDLDGATLESVRSHAQQCTACGLHEVRGRVVFGEGVETAPRWMFVGEAPGEYDDSTGKPFGGRPGELLRAMLAAVGIADGASAYFTNVLKCRPMGNRSPQAAEVAACLPLLRRQIRLLQPACLVALGRVSAGALLGSDDDLDVLRGRLHAYVDEDGRSIPVVVTHHPASLLLHGQLKAEAWRDLNLLPSLPD